MQASMQVGASPVQAQMYNPQMMAMMGMSYAQPYGMGFAGFMGGMPGMAQMYGQMGMMNPMGMGQMGMQGAMMMGGMAMPGPQAMGMMGMGGMGMMGQMDNTIEVAGAGMGKENKYKMFAGELLAVHSVLQDKNNIKADQMQAQLKERYGIDAEIKTVDGRKALVNKATGNTIMVDGNGDGVMGTGDMKFKDALNTVKEKFGIDPEQFAKMYDKNQGGVGATTGMNIPQMGVGMMGGQQMGMGMGQMYPFGMGQMGMGGMGQMGGAMAGIWGDPLWQNSIYGIFGGAMRYAGMFGQQGMF